MPKIFVRAPLDTVARGVTILVVALLVLVAFTVSETLLRVLIAVVIPFVTYMFSPRDYMVDDRELIVRLWGFKRRFALDSITEIKADPEAMSASLRVLGVGGLFGYSGRFRNSELGAYEAYLTSKAHAIVIKRSDGQPLVISPADTKAFLNYLRKDSGKSKNKSKSKIKKK